MADNFADFYTGAMAPPDRLPGGGLVPSVNYAPQASAADVYGGIIAPSAGRVTAEGLAVRPVQTVPIDSSGNPILNQVKANAVAQALVGAGGNQGGSLRANPVATALAAVNEVGGGSAIPGWNGQFNPNKRQDRLTQNAWMDPGGVPVQTAAVTPPRAQYGNYTASLRPAAQNVPVTYQAGGDRGLFGAQMSPGMASILNTDPRYAAQRSGAVPARSAVPITVRGGNKTQQALAQVAASQPQAAPRVAPNPGYVTTPYEQSWAQTTENALMPSAGGERRRTGY
jgi:hypothetical protein